MPLKPGDSVSPQRPTPAPRRSAILGS